MLVQLILTISIVAQFQFISADVCVQGKVYNGRDKCEKFENGKWVQYEAKWWVNSLPPGEEWRKIGEVNAPNGCNNRPPNGGNNQRPPNGGNNQRPPNGGNNQRPPNGGNNNSPRENLAALNPPTDLSSQSMKRYLQELISKVNPKPEAGRDGLGIWLEEIRSKLSGDQYEKLKEVAYYVRVRSFNDVMKITPGNPGNPENVKRVERILPQSSWNRYFPLTLRSSEFPNQEGVGIYSYENFLMAIGSFPAYCGDYRNHPNLRNVNADNICKKILATTFAHFNKETSAVTPSSRIPMENQGLYWVREVNCRNGQCGAYTIGQEFFPAEWTRGNTYFGRGAKQLSHPINYAVYSSLIFGRADVLLRTPDLVAGTWLALGSAIFFASTPTSSKPCMLEIMDGNYKPSQSDLQKNLIPGFGLTTHAINGAIECGGRGPFDSSGKSFDLVRANYYRYFVNDLQLNERIDERTLTCENVRGNFDLQSSSSRPYYLNRDGCQIVSWDTALPVYSGKDALALCR